jgi:uncharacterized protein YfaS (alpha-2-macroglobulin family)
MISIKSYMNQRNLTFLLFLTLAIALPLLAFQQPQNDKMIQQPYEKEWQEIDSLESEGLPRSALEKVEQLYQRAKKDEEHAQIVKTILYKGKYNNQLTDEGLAGSIRLMEQEVASAGFPVQAVLHSLLAEMYQRYLDDHYWKIKDRTNTSGFVPEELESYSIAQLLDNAARHYFLSLEGKTAAIPIEEFATITLPGTENVEGLRPTLFDFLAHRAIDHFMNDRSYLSQPASRFLIVQREAFASPREFANYTFETDDTTSYQYQTLLVFQQLLKERLKGDNAAALLDANLKRLKFVKEQSTLSIKDSLYLNALKRLEKQYEDAPEVAEVWYYIAEEYYSLGRSYTPEKETHKWKLKEALELCNKALDKYPDSYGSQLCNRLKSRLLSQKLDVEVETVNPANRAILASVSYQNLKLAYFRIVKIDEEQRYEYQQMRGDDVQKKLLSLSPVKSWKASLPDDGDLRAHRMEIAIEGLPFGEYALLAAGDESFESEDNTSGYLYMTISNMAYLSRRMPGGDVEMVVVDRMSGMPLEDVKAEIYKQEYNRRARKSERKKIGEGKTNGDGFFRPDVAQRNSYQVRFSKGEDVLFFSDNYSHYSNTRVNREQLLTHLFTDRSIYRPGQAIYYKAIVLNKKEDQRPEIVDNYTFTVTFYDANGQEVEQQELKSNSYGTANGVFTAPRGGLLGQMRLQSSAGEGSVYLSVEEYKRPKFEVSFEPLEGTPELGETVSVSGIAKAFAGSSIDGAEVNYRVVREVRYPWWPWWRWSRPAPGGGASQEIAAGKAATDAEGRFKIDFLAQPDRSVDKADKPEFVYTIYADVVDITGETQSSSKQLRLAYLGLKTDLILPESADRQKGMLEIELVTQNLDGNPQPTEGVLTIHQLQGPQRLMVSRYWEKPDRYEMSEPDFVRQFPHYAYKEEDQKPNWKKLRQISSQRFDTGKEKKMPLNITGLTVGHYELKMKAADQKGNEIETVKYLAVYDSRTRQLPEGILAWQKPEEQTSYQPGEQAEMLVATSGNELNVLYELEHRGNVQEQQWMKADNWHRQSYKVQEKDRGNVYAHLSLVKFGRVFLWHQNIYVPWENKKLEIEYSSFRDKLKPGQEEAWQIRIKGPNNEMVAAEMVAAMYDASLDQFRPHNWYFSPYPTYYSRINWQARHFDANTTYHYNRYYHTPPVPVRNYRSLNWFGLFYSGRGDIAFDNAMELRSVPSGRGERMMADMAAPPSPKAEVESIMEEAESSAGMDPEPYSAVEMQEEKPAAPPVRTNLKETVFFFPELRTDEEGNIVLRFTMNEALTRWKLLGMVHTKELEYALTEKEIITQKELMVLPNPPRFFREGDKIVYTAKVSNLTEAPMNGEARLQLFNALTMEPIDAIMGNQKATQPFVAPAGQSAPLSWELSVPEGEVMAVIHRVVAQAGNYSDGEENALPVLTNRTLVSETLPMPLKGGETRTFTFDAMEKARTSSTLKHHRFTLEMTSNPAWYAVKALPYLMDYPYECTEQIFSRYYANSLAASIANSQPAIQQVFEQWKNTDALVSELEKNQELKTLLLEETPWVRAAQSETEQRKRIGLLFDLNRMAYEQEAAIAEIAQRQAGNGGFSWFPGGRESWYITQYLMEGFGKLKVLGVAEVKPGGESWNVVTKGIRFIDEELVAAYEELMRRIEKDQLEKDENYLSSLAIHYLYTRSLFPEIPTNRKVEAAAKFYRKQAEDYWLKQGLYEQGLIALALYQHDKNSETAQKIVKSLKERALYSEELGMYWKVDYGYYWYQLPVETQSLMVEVFAKVADDQQSVEQLKVWLLKNKQTTHWKTTKATANAVYALLRYGDNWLMGTKLAAVSFPELEKSAYQAAISEATQSAEAGTGYFKASWDGAAVNTDFSKVKAQNPNEGIAWGAAYWQYFEDLDKVEAFEDTPLKMTKMLFKEVNGAKGPELVAAKDLKPGDKLVVRIELQVDRAMEYVHLKDYRASGLEPINVLSRYKWQGGLGYYESTRDAATNFFMDYLPKGKYVFEYPLRVIHRGDFSNGMASIQCMYAPEFTSHSEGQRIKVD